MRLAPLTALAAGTLIVGGKGKNTYDLEKMRDVSVVIDLGGNDTYRGLIGASPNSAAAAARL